MRRTENYLNTNLKFTIAVRGEMNSGKSTFLNAFLQLNVLPSSSCSETTNYFLAIHGNIEENKPMLYKVMTDKIYDKNNKEFVIDPSNLG